MPATVKIGSLAYRISQDPAELLRQEESMGDRVYGLGSRSQTLIMLRPSLSVEMAKTTMVHEIVHQVFEIAGWAPDDEIEEQVCRHLENGLLGVIRENPDLIAWLQADR